MTGAAIVEMRDVTRQETVWATDEVADRLETLQFTLGEGPCMQAVLCADVAFWALLGLRAGANPEGAEPQRLTDVDRPRAEIHRATGMVMAQLQISAESALATLRAFAYANAQPLNDVAHQVLTPSATFPGRRPVITPPPRTQRSAMTSRAAGDKILVISGRPSTLTIASGG